MDTRVQMIQYYGLPVAVRLKEYMLISEMTVFIVEVKVLCFLDSLARNLQCLLWWMNTNKCIVEEQFRYSATEENDEYSFSGLLTSPTSSRPS